MDQVLFCPKDFTLIFDCLYIAIHHIITEPDNKNIDTYVDNILKVLNISNPQLQLNYTTHFGDLKEKNWWFKIGDLVGDFTKKWWLEWTARLTKLAPTYMFLVSTFIHSLYSKFTRNRSHRNLVIPMEIILWSMLPPNISVNLKTLSVNQFKSLITL